ncbi:MAG TPA: DinB family protein [Terriglobales bacterium]|nr:DinB family protein [Terriglobales bacterium]
MQETPQQYTKRIMAHSDGKDPIRTQRATPAKLATLTKGLKKNQITRRPAPGKWSIAEILAHLADAELVVGFRMRLILGANGTPIQAFDQDVWATTFNYARRDPKTSLATFRALRENNLRLLKSVSRNLWENYGMHEERGQESVQHIVRMMAGHDLNHLKQVETIAKAARKAPRP